jgi:amino acid permease
MQDGGGGRSAEDEEKEKAAAIDNWLPISATRNAKWWYSAFHNVTAMVGAGVLGLPYAMSQLGWYARINQSVIISILMIGVLVMNVTTAVDSGVPASRSCSCRG